MAPGAWPLAGHTPALLRRPLEFFCALAQYGDLVRLRLGTVPVYVATHPELVHRILVTEGRHYTRGRFYEKAVPFLGRGLATVDGPEHRRQRRMLQSGFRAERLAAYDGIMRAAAETVADRWNPGQSVPVHREMEQLALNVVTRTLFGAEPARNAADAFRRALPVLTGGLATRIMLPDWFVALPLPANRRFDRAVRQLRAAVHQAVAISRGNTSDCSDLLSALLEARDAAGNRLSDREIADQTVTFASAGVETTSATLAWILHELGRHPDAETRVHEELDRVLGERPVRTEDLPELRYTGRVIAEALRLYPPWISTRRTRVAVTLAGATVPPGAEILYSAFAIHRDPRWYRDPARFDPDRWLPDRQPTPPAGAYLPFGLGPHKCIADSLAYRETAIALATICRRWRLRPVAGSPRGTVVRADLHPDRLVMRAEPRAKGIGYRTRAS